MRIVAGTTLCLTGLIALTGTAAAQRKPVTPATRVTARPVVAATTAADIKAAAVALGFTIKAGKVIDTCGMPVDAPEREDFDKDGQPELVFGNGMCLGGAAGWFGIARRLPTGRWQEVLSHRGVYQVLTMRRQSWPDILVGGPGCSGDDPIFRWSNGKYIVGGTKPRSCTNGAMSDASEQQVATQPVPDRQLPTNVQYTGYSGSDEYPVWNDFKVTRNGTQLSGSAYRKMGIFAGDGPMSGTYANGECTLVWRKDTFRGPCDASTFQGAVYDRKGKAYHKFSLRSQTVVAQAQSPATGYVAAAAVTAPAQARNYTVWSLGRVRILTERGNTCGEASLGKPYCFERAMNWLRLRPNKSEVDVIATDIAWMPGSMVNYNNGQGWSVYRVAKRGDGFAADMQRHFAVRTRVPPGCMYRGVEREAWYITVSGGRKVAVEATQYRCEQWGGAWLYPASADYADSDAGTLDYLGGPREYARLHPVSDDPVQRPQSDPGERRTRAEEMVDELSEMPVSRSCDSCWISGSVPLPKKPAPKRRK